MFNLFRKSLWNRRGTAILTIFSISISVTLLIGVENIRKGVRTSFSSAVSGTDIIVGARGGSLQLLLYSIFRIGNSPNNISWESYNELRNNKRVKWTIPISLGDSHRGFRVVGTNLDYFKYFRYGSKKKLVGDEEQGGCYGTYGRVRLQWEHTRKNVSENHSDKKTLLQFLQQLPYGTNIRHHIVGDVGQENTFAVQNRKIVNK